MPDHSPSYIYDVLLVIWRLVVNIFFREIRPRGAYNIPKSGPVILVAAPHANQFLDSFILMSEVHRETRRRVEALIAAKSMKRKVIGTFARWMSAIPVARAADDARPGSGLIVLSDDDSCTILGYGTRFESELKPKSQIMLPKSLGALTAEVVEIVSDSEVKIRKEFGDENEKGTLQIRGAIAQAKANGIPGLNFKCVPHIDQQEVYRFVYERLKDGGCIGIFPEGGSHDRTDLLPLKAGVTLMALGAMANDASIDVKIVPVGLSYFHAYKFRSRAVIEFGSPMDVPQELVELYKEGGVSKRQACSRLLDLVYERLKTVTLRAPDYETLMVIQAARRLYQTPGQHLTLSQVVQLNKRFLQAYLHFEDDPRVEHLKQSVLKYNRALRDLGLRDHQVPRAKPVSWKVLGLLTYRLGLLIFWSALALPGVVLNGPIFILVSIISRRKAEEALAESTVKVAGRDVIGSWKVIISVVAAPILYSIYAILALSIAIRANLPLQWRILTPILTLCSLPIMSYAALKFGETGTDILKSLRPLVIALFPGQHHRLNEIKRTRQRLSNELTGLVNELAPTLWEDFDKNIALIPSASTPSTDQSDLWSRSRKPHRSSFHASYVHDSKTGARRRFGHVTGFMNPALGLSVFATKTILFILVMHEQSQYAPAAHVPLIKSPSLRIPRPIEAPPDIHPLPDDINAYFVYPFTLEPHIVILESSRATTIAAHTARHEAYLRQREENKERRKREALRRIAPGFEPQNGPLVPTKVSETGGARSVVSTASQGEGAAGDTGNDAIAAGHIRQRSVMDDLVDHLAALDAAGEPSSGGGRSG